MYFIYGRAEWNPINTQQFFAPNANGQDGFVVIGDRSSAFWAFSGAFENRYGINNLGDIDGDGLSDTAVVSQGKAWVVYGQRSRQRTVVDSAANVASVIRLSTPDNQVYAQAIGLGDLNADGFDDFALNDGGVRIFLGRSNRTDPWANKTALIAPPKIFIGVVSAADLDGDGLPELHLGRTGGVGEPWDDYVLRGSTLQEILASNITLYNANALQPENGGNGSKGWIFRGHSRQDNGNVLPGLGAAIDSQRDVNADGIKDIIFGGYSAVVVFYGKAQYTQARYDLTLLYPNGGGDGTQGYVVDGADSGNFGLGHTLASIEDVNGDGVNDILAGSPFDRSCGSRCGRAVIIYGKRGQQAPAYRRVVTSLDAGDGITLLGQQSGGFYGSHVIRTTDYTGDGKPEILIAADSMNGNGVVFLYLSSGVIEPIRQAPMSKSALGILVLSLGLLAVRALAR